VAGDPILDWHVGVLKPAVMVSQSGGTVVGWRFDAAIGLDSLRVELIPAPNGGSIAAVAGLKIVGVASAWLTLPCGAQAGLINGSIQADGAASGQLTVAYDTSSHSVDANFAVQGGIDQNSGKISVGGIFGSILGDLATWLVHLGVIKIGSQFSERGHTVIWDAARINGLSSSPFINPRMRVGNASALVAMFDKEG
jgi:hypothetical protein